MEPTTTAVFEEEEGNHLHEDLDHGTLNVENLDELLCENRSLASLLSNGPSMLSISMPDVINNISGQVNFDNGQETIDTLSNGTFCRAHWDKLLCWNDTAAGSTVSQSCFRELHGVLYDTTKNAFRLCSDGGTWDKTNYSECIPMPQTASPSDEQSLEITTGVYLFGYCLSLCALVISMGIFLGFKELRCLRNRIHTHLMITYILSDALWIITSFSTFTGTGVTSGSSPSDFQTSSQATSGSGNQVSCVTFILLHYFHLTNFFWMFVEGLYLYVLVVKTFVADNIKLRVYAAIGWGTPLIVVIGWSIAKWLTQQVDSESSGHHETVQSLASTERDPELNAAPTCLWLNVNIFDWIYKAPAILVLAANMIFLLQIMWVLITKLRSATNPETQQSRKAAKALVVLMPLLGITYVLILTGSKEPVYEHLRALLISTQGFLVALLYCFLNGEVRGALRHRWAQLREHLTESSYCCCCCLEPRSHRDIRELGEWSTRTRTESIRLYHPSNANSGNAGPRASGSGAGLCQNFVFKSPRESCASETTTMTSISHTTGLRDRDNSNNVLNPVRCTAEIPTTASMNKLTNSNLVTIQRASCISSGPTL